MNVENRIQQIIKQRQNRLEGKFNCLPFTYHFPELSRYVPGLFKGSLSTILSATGIGKCLAEETKVLMYDGTLKKAENIKVGDQLMGVDSKPRTVLNITKGKDSLYTVHQSNGNSYTVNSLHLLSLKNKDGEIKNVNVRDDLTGLYGWKTSVEYSEKELPIDPYWLGLWLGDGNSRDSGIITIDPEIKEFIYNHAKKNDFQIKKYSKSITKAATYHTTKTRDQVNNKRPVAVIKDDRFWIFNSISEAWVELGLKGKPSGNIQEGKERYGYIWKYLTKDVISECGISCNLRDLNLIKNKHIPHIYKTSSSQQRLQLLAGLLDSDGYLNKQGFFEICQKSKTLINDIVFLARSLGFTCSLRERQNICKNCKNPIKRTYYSTTIRGEVQNIPNLIPRKKAKRPNKVAPCRINVESIGVGSYYGFELDGDNLFMLEDFTVTHNSKFARYLSVIIPYELHKRFGIKFRTIFFSLEESQSEFIDNMIVMLMKLKHNIDIDALQLNSYYEKTFDEHTLECLKDVQSNLKDLMQFVDVIDNIDNPTGIYMYCKDKATQWGTHHYKTININGKDTEVYSHYEANDPEQYIIVCVDHLSLLSPEKGANNVREAMSRWSSDYCVKQLAKYYNWCIINVQQTAMASDDLSHYKAGKLEPEISDAADNKIIMRDAKMIFTLFAADRYSLRKHNGYDITKLLDKYRNLGVKKNRYGRSNINVGLYFDGASGRFHELPNPRSDAIKKVYEKL